MLSAPVVDDDQKIGWDDVSDVETTCGESDDDVSVSDFGCADLVESRFESAPVTGELDIGGTKNEAFEAQPQVLEAERTEEVELVEVFFQAKRKLAKPLKVKAKEIAPAQEHTVEQAEPNMESCERDDWEDFEAVLDAMEVKAAEEAARRAKAAKDLEDAAEAAAKKTFHFKGMAKRIKNRAWIDHTSVKDQATFRRALARLGLKTQDVFVHQNQCPKELEYEGQVRFTLVPNKNGVMPEASEVSIVRR